MNALDLINPPNVYVEISESSLKLLDGENGLELSVERQVNGRLTPACRAELERRLREFLKRPRWQPRPRAVCALSARGVSLRRLSLPAASEEELQRLLPLQIEKEFPLSPEELAWGCQQLNAQLPPGNGVPSSRDLLVVALKRETLQEYSQLLSGCGLIPVFTLGALARGTLVPQAGGSYAVLELGQDHSELVCFDQGAPSSLRILPWGINHLTRAISDRMGVSREEAARLQQQWEQSSISNPEQEQIIRAAVRAELEGLATSLRTHWRGPMLYVAEGNGQLKEIASWLGSAMGGSIECAPMEMPRGTGRSTAILGLQKLSEPNCQPPLLVLQTNGAREREHAAPRDPWKWVALAGMLAVACLFLRYAEGLLFKPALARRLTEVNAYRKTLPRIDQELSFLQFLKSNQPPILDTIAVVANVGSGARVDSLSLSRRGDFSFRGSMRDSQQVLDFRSNLIESGFFATVTVEEQAPSADRQKVQVRITGQLTPSIQRPTLKLESPRTPVEKSKTTPKETKSPALTNTAPAAAKAPTDSPPPEKN